MAKDGDELAPAHEILQTDNLEVDFTAERFKGVPLLDTTVSIYVVNGITISWNNREEFASELQQVIDKYKL